MEASEELLVTNSGRPNPETSGRTAGVPALEDSTSRTVLCESYPFDGLERPGFKPVIKESESKRDEPKDEEQEEQAPKHQHSDSSDSCFDERRCLYGSAPSISITALEMTEKIGAELKTRVLNLGNQL